MALPNPPHTARPLIVHVTHRPPAPVLRYIDAVVGQQEVGIEYRYSQGVLTSFDIDVVHVVDADLDLLLGTKGATDLQRLLAAVVFARNLRRHRIRLVRFLHEFAVLPRATRVQRLTAQVLDRATTKFVLADSDTFTPDPERTVLIPVPEYSERFVGHPRSPMVPGRIACVSPGYLPAEARRLLAAPQVTATAGLSIRLAGLASRQMSPLVQSAVAKRPTSVSARLERLSDSAQVMEISAAEVVALPRVNTLEDVQLLLLSLSLRRPVITPASSMVARIADSVGSDWVYQCSADITPTDIDAAVEAFRHDSRSEAPRLEGRSLTETQLSFARVFKESARKR